MSKIIIMTQIQENYAWDAQGNLGTGVNAFWKMKGGNDYVVKDVEEEKVPSIMDRVRELVEHDSDAYKEYIVSWQVEEDDYLTEYEKDQIFWEGEIVDPLTELKV